MAKFVGPRHRGVRSPFFFLRVERFEEANRPPPNMPPKIPPRGVAVRLPKTLKTQKNSPRNSLGLPCLPSAGVGGRGESIVPKGTHRSTSPPPPPGAESKNEQGTKSNTQQSKGHIWCIIIFSFSWVFKVAMCRVSPVGFVRFGGLPYVPRGSTYQKTRVILDM